VAARSKAWVCGSSLAGIAGSSTTVGMDVCLLRILFVVRYSSLLQADQSSTGVLLSVMCVSECGREASIMKRPWPIGGCCAMEEINISLKFVYLYIYSWFLVYINPCPCNTSNLGSSEFLNSPVSLHFDLLPHFTTHASTLTLLHYRRIYSSFK